MAYHSYSPSDDISILYKGPHLNEGPMPTLFYFALSAYDSLELSPFNQPVQFLEKDPIRIFSMTLPAHENNLPPEKAIAAWSEKMKQGISVIQPFIEKAKGVIEDLFQSNSIEKNKLAVAGLSRGAFIACHVAALCNEVKSILGFAPLTRLSYSNEFQTERHNPKVTELNLENLVEKIYNRRIRFYIGNLDTRVGTENCFSFINKLAKRANEHRIRSSPIELIITPSVGYQGHGTLPPIFEEGAKWIKKELLLE